MTNQASFRRRSPLWGLLCALILAVAQLFSPAGVGTAQAATTDCISVDWVQTCTVTFNYTGAAETWTVPSGVTQATFDLYGAQGNDYTSSVHGGHGGRVTATLNVTTGSAYQVLVGGAGGFGTGGFNGGGNGSGRGGGASDVRTGGFALTDRILVAGGGGGAGTSGSTGHGGHGGYPNGGNGGVGNSGSGGGGGGGGTQTGPGGGGGGWGGDRPSGEPGTLGQGGGARGNSGGGGGGYYGGGGGGAAAQGGGPGGGGGGGSSYGPSGATYENGVREGNGLVIITYSQPDTLAPVASPEHVPAPAPSGWNNTPVTVSWNWTDPTTGGAYATGIDAANCTTTSTHDPFVGGLIRFEVFCSDLAGNVGTGTYQVLFDPTAPTANPTQNPAANAAGWNNTDVTVDWNWVYTGAEIDTANCTTSLTSSGEGVLTLNATCMDVATNQRTVPTPSTSTRRLQS